jgi:hypothetical protein
MIGLQAQNVDFFEPHSRDVCCGGHDKPSGYLCLAELDGVMQLGSIKVLQGAVDVIGRRYR